MADPDGRLGDDPRISAPDVVLSVLGASRIPIESLRTNIKTTNRGSLNEHRDALVTTVWALPAHPDRLASVRSGDRWFDSFEESIRYIVPISMYPREATASDRMHRGDVLRSVVIL
ncbi:hypothetical protein GCM10009676_38930 [Prauserella halophila]|uniref:Uncharacterized protein n=1 Tax=Prauserella halophila TaxID=185641 RepID=A0ABN1WI56_9PSEU|nr:hypothetical protein [Prauserella halophila]MCP2238164.1 hypothetical protein [Prauserella halophila]